MLMPLSSQLLHSFPLCVVFSLSLHLSLKHCCSLQTHVYMRELMKHLVQQTGKENTRSYEIPSKAQVNANLVGYKKVDVEA